MPLGFRYAPISSELFCCPHTNVDRVKKNVLNSLFEGCSSLQTRKTIKFIFQVSTIYVWFFLVYSLSTYLNGHSKYILGWLSTLTDIYDQHYEITSPQTDLVFECKLYLA